MSIKRIAIIVCMGVSLAIYEALAKSGHRVVVSEQGQADRREQKKIALREPYATAYPSWRKSKGEKKRAASNMRRKGWK